VRPTGVTLVLTNYKRVHAYPLWTVLRTTVCSYPIDVFQLSFNFLCLLLLYSIYLNAQHSVSANEYSCTVHRTPNKLWRYNSIFSLCLRGREWMDPSHMTAQNNYINVTVVLYVPERSFMYVTVSC
jgi:hypothetical protein